MIRTIYILQGYAGSDMRVPPALRPLFRVRDAAEILKPEDNEE